MNFMTKKQILKGLSKRLIDLENSYEVFSKDKELQSISKEYEIRIDEVESLIYWIEGKTGN